ncbi:xanthine dehydrogenase family protein subunit M [Aneurinibacillus migulanus]|uniref:FAD binding domain-containing protein n=1 Tax=Aneurinibacillus migulanus TaxID=47500 RepID=UPI002E21D59F|nr:xanthine dehydrogenase family protein subunit M [Aneurinibacillus migulanus]
MKPAAFDYYTPKTVREALELIEDFGYDAKILAGGQSLIPTMNMRLARPQALIDIGQLDALDYIQVTDTEIQIGAMVRHYAVEHSSQIAQACPMLSEGIRLVGHSQIRSRGTIGGSLVHADSTAELPVMLRTLGGTVTLASLDEERTIEAEEFFLTYLTTTIEANEILVSAQFPKITGRTGHAIEEFTLRKGDFAIVLAAASVTLDEEGKIESVSLGLGGVDGAPVKLDDIEDELAGEDPDSVLIAEYCETIREAIDPEPDIHASTDYRKDLSVTLSRRVLEKAVQHARGQYRHV